MKLIAHRGLVDKNTRENTYDSIIKALKSDKYVGVEFDVRVTKDHEFVIYHNAFVDDKLIKNTNYNELPKYIPKLSQILKFNTKKILLVEIKDIGDCLDKFVLLLNKYKNRNIYVMSFNNKIISKISKKNIKFKIGVLNYILNSTEIKNMNFICILDSFINQLMLDDVNKLKKEVFSYAIINNKNIGKYNIYYIVDDKMI